MHHLQHLDGDYDWSNATPEARERFQFPPFGVDELTESLDNLATLTSPARDASP